MMIPNAVGLATATEKHVFSSLLSQDSTFKFLTDMLKRFGNVGDDGGGSNDDGGGNDDG